jgi:hypothetical protein
MTAVMVEPAPGVRLGAARRERIMQLESIRSIVSGWLCALAIAAPAVAAPPEDVPAGAPTFREGDSIPFDELERLRPFLPSEIWDNRELFFFAGMQLVIGPAFRDYAAAPEYQAATARFGGQARLGGDGSLRGHVAGEPFPMAQIDCRGDPDAGAKLAWNFDHRWEGDGAAAHFRYTYWDRGEELPLFYEGTSKRIRMTNRVEPQYLERSRGDLFRAERRKLTFGIEVDAPFDSRGLTILTYRYKESEKPLAETRNDDTWVYVPTLRRVRRISSAQRTDAVSGTDFTFDDLFSFSGIVPQYVWACLGRRDLIAPMNSAIRAYPYDRHQNFGPYGLSYANDRWELRHAVAIRMVPRNADHPYDHKDLYLDAQTLEPLYSFAYDRKGELWKIITHNHRWSEDDPAWYAGWAGVARPHDLRTVSDTVANVQTGTGNRIEFWDSHGMPLSSPGKVRRYVDVGRLTKGR